MTSTRNDEPVRRRIALIAHDHKKADLRDWALYNRGLRRATAPAPTS